MKNALLIIVGSIFVASCGVSQGERFAQRLAKHQEFCTNAGYKKGTDEYSYCVNARETRYQNIVWGD